MYTNYGTYLKLFLLHKQLHLLHLLDTSNSKFKVQVQLYLFSYYNIQHKYLILTHSLVK